jgi:hypothetical protein
MIYLDMSNAFPSLNHNILIEKLDKIGFKNKDLKLLKSYIIGTTHLTQIGKHFSNENTFKNGVWQGSCLASTLFNIYINDLAKIDEDIYMYADDIGVIIKGENTNEINTKSNIIMEKIAQYAEQHKLKFNDSKCEYITFRGRKRYNNKDIHIFMNKVEITQVEEYKYLGITFDTKLNWSIHKNNLMNSINKYITLFYTIRDYIPTNVALLLYKVMVISKINYCIEIYGNTDMSKLQNKLDKILTIINYKNKNKTIEVIKKENNINNLNENYKIKWLQLCHDIIYNSYKLPIYYKNLIKLVQNRNGISIETKYRKSKFGDNISHNIMQNIWNKINKNIRAINEKNLFIYEYMNTELK